MNGLQYLKKHEIDNKRVKLLLKDFKLLYSYDGVICKKCGRIQGKPHEKWGIKKYYCDWVYSAVNNKLKKEKEKLTAEMFKFIISSLK